MAAVMPKIIDCQAKQCVYNRNGKCNTPAITVGDDEPCCDTFSNRPDKGGFPNIDGCVGACKVSDCEYNNSLECTASGIHVVVMKDHPDCGTYRQRK